MKAKIGRKGRAAANIIQDGARTYTIVNSLIFIQINNVFSD